MSGNINPESCEYQGVKGPLLREGPQLPLSLSCEISPRDMGGGLCGGTSLPHLRKKTCVSRPRPNPSKITSRQGRHQQRWRRPYTRRTPFQSVWFVVRPAFLIQYVWRGVYLRIFCCLMVCDHMTCSELASLYRKMENQHGRRVRWVDRTVECFPHNTPDNWICM